MSGSRLVTPLLAGPKGSGARRSFWTVGLAGSVSPERGAAISPGVVPCYFWGLFRSHLQHATNTSISLVNSHANRCLFILIYLCKHILQIWKMKVGTKKGKSVSFFFSRGRIQLTLFVWVFVSSSHLSISCCLMFISHIIKRSGCNLQGHKMMEVNVALDVFRNGF